MPSSTTSPSLPLSGPDRNPGDHHPVDRRFGRRSVADRWASAVAAACESPDDVRTLTDWSRQCALSYGSLRELCELVSLRPRRALMFARVLRVVLRSGQLGESSVVLFDVADRRTIRRLLRCVGFPELGRGMQVEEFLARQTVVDDGEGLLSAVRVRLTEIRLCGSQR